MNKGLIITLLIILAVVIVAAIGIQFVPVERTNPAAPAPLLADAAVLEVLRASCYDCHSNESVWPWYAHVAPVSWYVAHDVEEARGKLNFSEWASLSAEKQAHGVEEIMEEIEDGGMPLPAYLRMHPAAKLDAAKIALLKQWAAGFQLTETRAAEPAHVDEADQADGGMPEEDTEPADDAEHADSPDHEDDGGHE